MTTSVAIWFVIVLSIFAANLPWLTERIFFMKAPNTGLKRAWWRWGEWLVLYFVTGYVALGMERKVTGEIYHQDWEFYAVTFCLFLVFALPGFIYRHDLRQHLSGR